MFYECLIKDLRTNNTFEKCLTSIINPFSLYYLCHHYYGDEIKKFNIPIPYGKHDLLRTKDLSKIKEYDIIHCQVKYFRKFCDEVLHKINKKFILTTGQWHLPQIQKSELTEMVLRNKNVILWLAQNPIYDNSDKYIAFPYGISHENIQTYANILIHSPGLPKSKGLIFLPLNNRTHPCRKKLPIISNIPVSEYYKKMLQGKFIISPIGDRDDCYRHYEAIGLGTIPISNASIFYKNIFTTNMVYSSIDEMVEMLRRGTIDVSYHEPNKELICFEYYRNVVNELINHRKKGEQILPLL